MSRVLVLSSSIRKPSNSEALCQSLARGVRDAGGEAVVLRIGDMNIGPCRGCDYCRTHGNVCSVKDDMELVHKEMCMADALVLATPVYFWNVSSQLKALWDRTFALHPYEKLKRIKKSALLTTAGVHREHTLDAVVAGYKGYIWCIGGYCDRIESVGIICIDRVRDPSDIADHPGLREAYELGRKIVS
jgi:multimeric flavodoxin WrbA